MNKPLSLIPASADDPITDALSQLEVGGIAATEHVVDALRRNGLAISDIAAQPVLIEIIFQLLNAVETDPADPAILVQVRHLDGVAAQAAVDLLMVANFGESTGKLRELGDGTVLLLAALKAVANGWSDAIGILLESEITRPAMRFRRAATQLRYQLQDDDKVVAEMLFGQLLDGLDHPEIWPAFPVLVQTFPGLTDILHRFASEEVGVYDGVWNILHALGVAASDAESGLALLEPIAIAQSQSVLAQGVYFHALSLVNGVDSAAYLEDRFCGVPFEELDVLDGGSHLCCANYVPASVGDISKQPWESVWNSDTAQSIRAGILDGSFRYCNKIACPRIAGDTLPLKAEAVRESEKFRDVIDNYRVLLPGGPHRVNLAYDRTCNLSCPSCRIDKFAANSTTRARYDALQETQILPMLRHANFVFITGSGDPFASKNFRTLMERLGPEDYPDLRFELMTNGMLFTPEEWARFPALHNRVASLRISLDAATGPTHELLRRGARWPVMEKNLAFASTLRAAGLIDRLDLAFTAQVDNYREMGDAVDLARSLGADHIGFTRMTNWGTFTADEYAQKAVCMPSHPEHQAFVEAMQDPRLLDPVAGLHDLKPFLKLSPELLG